MRSCALVRRVTVPALLLLAIAPAMSAQEAVIGPDAPYARVAAELEAFISREMHLKGIPALSIALVDDQRVVWSRGFGIADSAKGRMATAHTVYRVGSVSKLFTDIGVMQLVERGEIDLDAPVTRYLPEFAPRRQAEQPVTLRQLMSHHAGVVREPPVGNYFDTSGVTLAQMVASLNRTALVHRPGTTHKYSNAAVGVVGFVLERRSGMPFAPYLQQSVLEPLGLSSSAFELRPDLASRLAVGRMWTYHGREFDAPGFQLGMAPAGSMYSTMPDLARFLSTLFAGGNGPRGRVLQEATLAHMWTPQFATSGARTGVGLGFQLGVIDGLRTVSHAGAIYGFATELLAAPDEKLGVAVSATKDGMNAFTARIAARALRLMHAVRNGGDARAADTTTAVSLVLANRMEGRYGSGEDKVEVVVRDSTPFLSGEVFETRLQLRRWRGDTLVADDGLAFGPSAWLDGDALVIDGRRYPRRRAESTLPPEPRAAWVGLVGEYGWDHNVLYVSEKGGRLTALIEWFFEYPLTPVGPDTFAFPERGLYSGERLVFTRDASGRATQVEAASVRFPRRTWVGENGGIFRITPVKPVERLRADALAARPPAESGSFRPSELTELVSLDSTILLDVRYASDRNFLSVPVYTQARAFLQKPAADALVRAHRALRRKGYGLLVHDGYRPWYVTKMFWDGTPVDKHQFVADPSSGSRHNRGCAVDLTLYDLRSGEAVLMPGGYDEMSDRSYPEYPGGTSRQRALRELLRDAMEAEGFRVYDAEWWHFDYKDWRSYRIGNERFEELGIQR